MTIPLHTAILQDQHGELVLLFPQEIVGQFQMMEGMVVDLQVVEGKLMIFFASSGDAVGGSAEDT
ncbi:hypothetical protein GCM10008938_51250 [Deinococcus roseus]|uniref:DUF4926 domain-containing protein n=2 Tax=Deinococcus roseus TaxID=392414 RepID=A0ABQ2DI57_9DEIO|nr:hypothetical protein GCM10008938_51250 [Deinococcus roseus]